MKKLFILFSVIICSSSCCNNYKQSTEQVCRSIGNVTSITSTGATTKIQKIEYENHSYILVTSIWIEGCGVSLVHDPDCPCNKKQ